MTVKANSHPIQGEYSPRFRAAVVGVLENEGGLVDDLQDRGGITNFGISLRFLAGEGALDLDGDGLADFDLDCDGDIDGADVRKLTREDAIKLYHRCFWVRLKADSLPAPIGEMVFDQAVNAGLLAAKKLLQQAVNICLMGLGERHLLTVDGEIGPITAAAISRISALPGVALPEAYRSAVRERYREIVRRSPSQQKFLKGWLARADRLGR